MKIGIIGAGISGLTAASLLSDKHDITVFEQNNYVGGHTATVDVLIDGVQYAVDTGFIVYNEWTYPNFISLLKKLDVDSQPTSMSFSVTSRNTDFEYAGSNLNTLFSQRENIFSIAFIGMLKDVVRFNLKAKKDLKNQVVSPTQTLENYLREGGYGPMFVSYYIVPMASAIWSASSKTISEFQALFFLRFFKNHGLLNLMRRPQWRVVKNGSKSYIPALIRQVEENIFVNTAVHSVKRNTDSVTVVTDKEEMDFDQIIVATHSDQAIKILSDITPSEKDILSAIPYQESSIILHTDANILPQLQRAWSSWNYLLDDSNNGKPVLTYNMNILQGINAPQTLCVTVNGEKYIDQSKIIRRFNYAHPQFDVNSIVAQRRWSDVNGKNRTWFCGAYWGNGFHEDGVVSAQRVVDAINAQ